MPTREPAPVDVAAQSAVLPVKEVIAIVRAWVELHARHLCGFASAYLWGGITALPADAPFPLYRDVDIGWKNLADHRDVEAVLALTCTRQP